MNSAELDPATRRTFALVLVSQALVIAGLWLVGVIYG